MTNKLNERDLVPYGISGDIYGDDPEEAAANSKLAYALHLMELERKVLSGEATPGEETAFFDHAAAQVAQGWG